MLAEITKNVKIIQPQYMRTKGTMCSTELWSLKDKCEYKFMMKGEVEQLFVPFKDNGNFNFNKIWFNFKIKNKYYLNFNKFNNFYKQTFLKNFENFSFRTIIFFIIFASNIYSTNFKI